MAVAADEVRALVGIAAKNFVGVVDGKNGVKLVSSDVVVREDGSAEVAIVYEQGDVVEAKVEVSPEPEETVVEQPAAVVPGLVIPSAVG